MIIFKMFHMSFLIFTLFATAEKAGRRRAKMSPLAWTKMLGVPCWTSAPRCFGNLWNASKGTDGFVVQEKSFGCQLASWFSKHFKILSKLLFTK